MRHNERDLMRNRCKNLALGNSKAEDHSHNTTDHESFMLGVQFMKQCQTEANEAAINMMHAANPALRPSDDVIELQPNQYADSDLLASVTSIT